MEPSRIGGEMPHNARERVVRTMTSDPFSYFMLAVVVYAAIRWINGGIGLKYDFEFQAWSLRSAMWPYMPGSVEGTAVLPFAASGAMTTILLGDDSRTFEILHGQEHRPTSKVHHRQPEG